MKYCMNCGMLLEDSHEICIGCGADVTKEGSWSLYPIEMAKVIEKDKKEKKDKTLLIIAMVAVFILLVASISVFVIFNASRMEEEAVEQVATEEVIEDEPEEPVEEAPELVVEEPVVEEPVVSDREIKDNDGRYYNVGELRDLAGNVVFTTVYPEDFNELAANINYGIYSTKYPESITYIVGNEDGNVQMTYMSPQHYWYRKSDKGKSRTNERDVYDYMQFLTYKGADGYIDALIKQSYTDIKGFKLIDKEEFSSNITSKLEEVSKDHTMELTGEIGDYAKVASDTVYAAMEAEFESYIYHYQATSRHGNTIYMDFYVPVIANKLGYASEEDADKGEITEWVIPQFVAFEAGNEELYNYYKDAFTMFIYNSKPTEEFLYLCKAYSDELEDDIAKGVESETLSGDKLQSLISGYQSGADLGRFGNGIASFINTNPNTCSVFDGDKVIIGGNDSKVAFFSEEKEKVFISPTEDEYPGSEYVDLSYHAPEVAESSDDSNASDESSEESSSGVS